MRFRQIEDQRDNWPVRVMCDALSVSPSGYYAWRSRPESPRKSANRALLGFPFPANVGLCLGRRDKTPDRPVGSATGNRSSVKILSL
jgi:hypothetical protein